MVKSQVSWGDRQNRDRERGSEVEIDNNHRLRERQIRCRNEINKNGPYKGISKY